MSKARRRDKAIEKVGSATGKAIRAWATSPPPKKKPVRRKTKRK